MSRNVGIDYTDNIQQCISDKPFFKIGYKFDSFSSVKQLWRKYYAKWSVFRNFDCKKNVISKKSTQEKLNLI